MTVIKLEGRVKPAPLHTQTTQTPDALIAHYLRATHAGIDQGNELVGLWQLTPNARTVLLALVGISRMAQIDKTEKPVAIADIEDVKHATTLNPKDIAGALKELCLETSPGVQEIARNLTSCNNDLKAAQKRGDAGAIQK